MSDIILKADRVLVGEDLNLKEHMAVIVRDGKIEEIVPQAECPAVEGDRFKEYDPHARHDRVPQPSFY